jgi:predicted DNA-binding WGR domain protein
MTAVALYRIDPAHNMARFYTLAIERDLFAPWCVVTERGRLGRRGQVRRSAYPDVARALAALEKGRAAKERRGYTTWRVSRSAGARRTKTAV